MVKILCIGDSLGLPRDGVEYDETWHYILSREMPDTIIYPFFVRNQTTESLRSTYSNFVTSFKPQIIIVQLGICDCSPRIINDKSVPWKLLLKFSRLVHMESTVWRIIKLFWSRTNPKRVYVRFERFKKNVFDFSMDCMKMGVSLVFINIANPAEFVKRKSVCLKDNIDKYNSVFSELSSLYPDSIISVDPLSDGIETDYIDGYHTNARGFRKVALSLIEIVRKPR